MKKELPIGQKKVLNRLIEETKKNGPATLSRVQTIVDTPGSARGALERLQIKGYVRQPYPGGPYQPTRTASGEYLQLQLVPASESNNKPDS